MRTFLLLISLSALSAFSAFGQMLGGTLVDEGRKLASDVLYVQEGRVNGWAIFELAVDREGNVTGVELIETNVKSTPSKYELRNYVKTIQFQKGTHYPKFHHVRMKFTLVKPKN
jgi:hypothetical protein